MKQNWERQKNIEKENNSYESEFSENEIPDSNSLKPLKSSNQKQIPEMLQ